MAPARDIDRVIELVKSELPGVTWEQLKVAHPGADDDGIWYFKLPGTSEEVSAESWNGMCPFLIETDKHNERKDCHSVEATVETVVSWLRG